MNRDRRGVAALVCFVALGVGLSACSARGGPGAPPGASSTPSSRPLTYDFGVGQSESTSEPPLITVLAGEVQRSLGALAAADHPPYFLSYQVITEDTLALQARYGALFDSQRVKSSNLNVDIRVGAPGLDNTHPLHGDEPDSTYQGLNPVVVEGAAEEVGAAALRNAIWLATEREYDAARQGFLRASASAVPGSGEPGAGADFSAAPAYTYFQPALPLAVDSEVTLGALETLIRDVSALADEYPGVYSSAVGLVATGEVRSLVNSEGAKQSLSRRRVRLDLEAEGIAADGMVVTRTRSFHLASLLELPPRESLLATFQQTLDDVQALLAAPLVEPYVGPALLEGRAAGVFLHEVFGHRVEGHRQEARNEGQTFAGMIGQRVMHPDLSIYDDPRLERLGPFSLNGHYVFDDEGVLAQRADLVERGVLRTFLLSRATVGPFAESNGHGRRQAGHAAVARQANLVAQPRAGLAPVALKQALLDEMHRQGLPYALRFEEIDGGYTQTQRGDAQAFKVLPVMVYRVSPDGGEELVRGVDIEGTPLTALSKIVAIGRELHVFNGMCGAESGWVPVSAVAPALVVKELEVARKEVGDQKPPLSLPPERGAI